MSSDDPIRSLEMRISRIESLLENVVKKREPSDIKADEIEAYRKVRDVIAADWGEFCGINDCFRCIIQRCLRCYEPLCTTVCQVCAVECVCGPCNIGRYGGSIRRFQDLGY